MTRTGWQYVVMSNAPAPQGVCTTCVHRATTYGLGPCPSHAPTSDAYTLPDGTTR